MHIEIPCGPAAADRVRGAHDMLDESCEMLAATADRLRARDADNADMLDIVIDQIHTIQRILTGEMPGYSDDDRQAGRIAEIIDREATAEARAAR